MLRGGCTGRGHASSKAADAALAHASATSCVRAVVGADGLARSIVRAHGGTVTATPNDDGGLTVIVTLPESPAKTA